MIVQLLTKELVRREQEHLLLTDAGAALVSLLPDEIYGFVFANQIVLTTQALSERANLLERYTHHVAGVYEGIFRQIKGREIERRASKWTPGKAKEKKPQAQSEPSSSYTYDDGDDG